MITLAENRPTSHFANLARARAYRRGSFRTFPPTGQPSNRQPRAILARLCARLIPNRTGQPREVPPGVNRKAIQVTYAMAKNPRRTILPCFEKSPERRLESPTWRSIVAPCENCAILSVFRAIFPDFSGSNHCGPGEVPQSLRSKSLQYRNRRQ